MPSASWLGRSLNLANKRPAFRENIHRLFDEAQQAELGPGIVSLIESRATHAQIREIAVTRILPNPAQPRLSYEEDSLTELADSIREHGVLQPILVRPVGSQFELIAGERRWRASRLAGREAIPAIVVEFDATDGARGLDHREPAARGRLPAGGGDDVPQDDGARLLGPPAGAEDRQGQGLCRESDAAVRCAARDPRAGVRAQRHPQPRLRADEDPGRADAPAAGQEGRGRRADARQAAGR